MNKILIIGAGELGTALEFCLKNNPENKVNLWDRKAKKVKNWQPFEKVILDQDVIFLAVPTVAVAEIVKKIGKNKPILVILSKGLTREGKTALEASRENYSGPIVNISGPMIAEEVLREKKAWAMAAGNKIEKLAGLFRGTSLFLEKTNDLIGLSWSGPLKNLYAIGLGIAKEEKKGPNYQGWFIFQAVKEMGEIIAFFKGRKKTAFSLAGLGDLIATGFSSDSGNFQLGVSLARGEKPKKLSEGVTVALGIERRLGLDDFPLLKELVLRIKRAVV